MGGRSEKIIGLGTKAPPELKLLYNNQQVTNVYKTQVIFFNRGNEAIRHDDVIRNVTIILPDALILRDPVVRAVSNQEIKINGNIKENNKVELDFKYLDHNDGVVLELSHTKNDSISCSANLLGVGEPRYIGQFLPHKFKFLPSDIPEIIFPLVSIIGINIAFFFDSKARSEMLGVVFIIVISVLFLAMLINSLINRLRFLKFPNWSAFKD